jgi:hypothetical protein
MKNMKTSNSYAILAAMAISATAMADISDYSQDFEGLDMNSPSALGDDGWLVGANVFSPSGDFLYNYFAFPAPNGGPAFSAIAAGEGGMAQGAQQLSVYSDYNNQDHAAGNLIEANVFREYTVGANDIGTTRTFSFDAKLGNLEGGSTALAFIKTLTSDTFELTNFVTVDLTATPDTWNSYSLSLDIDAGLEGQIFQIGFLNTATGFEGSGVFYDNINSVPAPGSLALLGGMTMLSTRRRR